MMPTIPPAAAPVTGTVTPHRPACTISPGTGLAWANSPVVNCGASRTNVAAAVNASAPSAPITNPSNDSRVADGTSRTMTAGTTIRSIPTVGMAKPAPKRWCKASPTDIGTP